MSVEASSAGRSDPDAAGPERSAEPLRLVHHHAGYVRARAGAFVGARPSEGSAVAATRDAAETTPGFRRWSHDPKTGSILVEYDPAAVDVDGMLRRLASAAGLRGVVNDIREPPRDREQLVNAFLDQIEAVNRLVGRATGGRADLRELVPAALVAISVVSFVIHDDRGRLPPWNSALYHSYRVFMHWHRREVRAHESAARRAAYQRRSTGADPVP